mmetsp:Transcript_84783/g.236604  ORF Transcript_84783/g.236604 Transcript_84783/m.236604 type:complete len:264 (-) Transcript_84783:1093-1884(-)
MIGRWSSFFCNNRQRRSSKVSCSQSAEACASSCLEVSASNMGTRSFEASTLGVVQIASSSVLAALPLSPSPTFCSCSKSSSNSFSSRRSAVDRSAARALASVATELIRVSAKRWASMTWFLNSSSAASCCCSCSAMRCCSARMSCLWLSAAALATPTSSCNCVTSPSMRSCNLRSAASALTPTSALAAAAAAASQAWRSASAHAAAIRSSAASACRAAASLASLLWASASAKAARAAFSSSWKDCWRALKASSATRRSSSNWA